MTTTDLMTRTKAADPVTPAQFDDWAMGPEGRRLLRQIVATPPEPRPASRMPRRVAMVAIAACLATLVAVIAPVSSEDPIGSALATEQRDGILYLRVKDAAADPEDMTRDLRAAGIDGEVVTIPVVPALVGKWIEAEYDSRRTPVMPHNGPGPEPIRNQVGKRVEVLQIPADFSTWIRLKVGRVAEPGEIYAENPGTDELRPDGALACLGLEAMTPPQAAEELASYGYTVTWSAGGEQGSEPPATGTIFWAWFMGPDRVYVTVDLVGHEAAAFEDTHNPPSGIEGPC